MVDSFTDLDNKILEKEFFIKEYNLMIWPLIRSNVLSYFKRGKYKTTAAHAKQSLLSFGSLKYVFDTLLYPPQRLNNVYDIIFYTNARGRLGDRNFNVYSDYYSSLNDKPLVVDISYRGRYFIPDDTESFATGEYELFISFLHRQLKKFFLNKKNKDIERFISFLKSEDFVDEKFANHIRDFVYKFHMDHNYLNSYHKRVFDKLQPKIIFVQTGAYGYHNAILIRTAKNQGIITAEFQHGTISKEHHAYNYGEKALKSEEYRRYFPDYVLTYGDYWNEQMDIPGKAVTIGAPHFYESIKKHKNVKERKKTILVVSQGTVTNIFVDIAKYLSESLSDHTIIFKLHPGEVPFEDRYRSLYKHKNVKVAKSGDIYKFIAECEHIVAHTSTTIFEAMGFDKKIYVLDDELSRMYIPKDIGVRFKDKEELIELIEQSGDQEKSYDVEHYFNPNWKKNYEKFLEGIVGI